MDIVQAIYGRKSIREFTSKDIDDEDLKKIILTGTHAPSACDRQGWRFIIIKSKKVKESIINIGATNLIRNSPVGILVLYNNMTDNLEYQDHIQSAAACIQNMLLIAHGMNIGSCWLCNLPEKKKLKKMLNIPFQYTPIAYIMLGYPKDDVVKKKRRYKYDEVAYKEKFQNKEKVNYSKRIFLVAKRFGRKVYHKIPFKKSIKPIVDNLFEKKF